MRATVRYVVLLAAALACPAPAQSVREAYRLGPGVFDNHMEYHQITLDPGQEFTMADLAGPGLITYFYWTDNNFGDKHPEMNYYSGLVLKIYWDGEKEPSVWLPLRDFFGALDRQPIDYESVYLALDHEAYMSHFPMPFSGGARFVMANDGNRRYSQSVAYGIDYEKSSEFAAERSRFHAAWRRSNPVQEGLHRILEVEGRGQYVGNFLQVFTRYRKWWGEGDTIFYVDGKKMTHTPGTEDEYGSCWGFGKKFSYLYSGYLQDEGGRNRVYRFYATNPVRFQKSLRVEIQNQRIEQGRQTISQDDYTSVAYWYQDGAHAAPALQSFAERVGDTRAIEYK